MSESGYSFFLTRWSQDGDKISAVRTQVLVHELGYAPQQIDLNNEDTAFHILVADSAGRVIGAGRMQQDGKVDYIAVLRPWRRRTVGRAMLRYMNHIAYVKQLDALWVESPEKAQKFFEKQSFVLRSSQDFPAGQRWERQVERPGNRPARTH